MEKNKDPWKSIIEKDQEAFNQRKPRDLWNDIEKELDSAVQEGPKTIELWKVYRIAAVLLVAFAVCFWLMFQQNDQNQVAQIKDAKEVELLYPEELLEVESFYTSEIQDKLSRVRILTDDDVIVQEIESLKDEFDQLKLEFGDNVNDGEILEAMILNYKLRLDLLKEILDDLERDEEATPKKMNYEEI